MQTKLIKFNDFDDNPQEVVAYFNITKTEGMDFLDLQPRIQRWQDSITTTQTELTTDQIREMLAILKFLIDLSYGERSEDGKFFRKSPQILDDFKSTQAYDALIFSFFSNPEDASDFMEGIFPRDISTAARAEMEKRTTSQVEIGGELTAVDAEVPAYIRENRQPTPDEFMKMSKEEQLEAFKQKSKNPN